MHSCYQSSHLCLRKTGKPIFLKRSTTTLPFLQSLLYDTKQGFNVLYSFLPSVSLSKTKCQEEAGPGPSKIGTYKPQCDEQGNYKPIQCWHGTGYCWCVDKSGTAIEGTSVRGYPDCQKGKKTLSKGLLIQRCICNLSCEAIMEDESK